MNALYFRHTSLRVRQTYLVTVPQSVVGGTARSMGTREGLGWADLGRGRIAPADLRIVMTSRTVFGCLRTV